MTQSWFLNGERFIACDSVPLSDRGFRYGMSVFESMPVRDGVFVFLAQHLARLQQACECCGFQTRVPPAESFDECSHTTLALAFARIYVTVGDGSVTSDATECRVFVFIEPREPVPSRVYHRGYDLGIAPGKYAPLFGGLKTGNYWANLLAFRAGIARQKNETLLWNQGGELISACMANVFIVREGRVFTPPLASGARDGVVREWVMQRRDVEEHPLFAADVNSADEIFLTSSWLGVMPAASIEERALASRDIGQSLARELAG